MTIPVNFVLNGTEYNGTLESISGAGSGCFYLYVNKFYWATFLQTENGWQLTGNQPGIEELRDHFERVVISAGG